jgi:subtilisin-like proprotein convertase family protein
MGSAAQDVSGNMAIGFSASDATIKPQIRYAGRLVGDPLNALTQGEKTLFAGTGAQTGTLNRWGDYSDLTIDPVDDCTFWYTQEYIPSDGSFNWKTRIGNFKYPSCSAGPTGTAHFTVKASFNNSNVAGASVSVDGNPIGTTDAGGVFDVILPVGSHTYSVSKTGYTTQSGNFTINDSLTTNINVSLPSVSVIASGGAPGIIAESCTANGAIDPGETVTVSLPVTNNGGVGSTTTALTGTLQASGGVTNPSGAQNYGAVAAGSTVSRNYTFTASAALACGAPITMTLQLQDGATNYGTVTYTLNTGALQTTLSQNFDGVVAPALPAGWTATNVQGVAPLWVTSTTGPDTAPNSAFVDDAATVSDKVLDSPSIAIPAGGATFTFRHNFNTESGFDGGVLEIAIGAGAFADIVTAGGSFATGGYTGTISSSFGSPIGGRSAWTGSSGGYITTTVNLPPAANGQNVKLRWRMASDSSVSATGWNVDGVSMTSYVCCGAPAVVNSAGAPPITFDSGANGKMDPGELVTVNLTLVNNGGSPTTDATARLQLGGGVTSIVGTNPQHYGVLNGGGLAPSQSATKPFTFRVDPQLACGSNVTLTFALADGATSFGNVSYVFQTGTPGAITTTTFTNSAPITINDNAVASPYPSTINVSGFGGTTSNVTVTLKGFTHTFPDDVDVLLVSPTGQKYIMMSDVGGGGDVAAIDVTLDDAAAAGIPDAGPLATGSFKPSNVGANDPFAAPAPAAPYLNAAPGGGDTFASAFGGANPNGVWSLYVVDDATGDLGSFAGGWSITISAQGARTCQAPTAAKVNVSGRVLTADGAGLRNATVTLRDSAGNVRTVTTGAFGYYLLTGVDQGSYVIGVSSRLFRYAQRPLVVSDTLTDVDFWPNQ